MTEIDLKQQLFPRLSWRKKYQEQIGGKSHFTYGGPLCDPRRWRFASARANDYVGKEFFASLIAIHHLSSPSSLLNAHIIIRQSLSINLWVFEAAHHHDFWIFFCSGILQSGFGWIFEVCASGFVRAKNEEVLTKKSSAFVFHKSCHKFSVVILGLDD